MRGRTFLPALLIGLAALGPPLLYEALQKASEHTTRPSGLLRLSARAEWETPWRPQTGRRWLDLTLHELQETRRFYDIAGRQLRRALADSSFFSG